MYKKKLDLTGRHALVTGGGRGIGLACAEALAEFGAEVVIADFDMKVAAEGQAALAAKGYKAETVKMDVTNSAEVTAVADDLAAKGRTVEILVNNAGIARYSNVDDLNLEDINALLDVNVRSAVIASGAAMPHLPSGGRIITIGSCLAERVFARGSTLYSMTKSALLAFNRGLARDLGARDITVNLVQPGPIDTDMNPANGEHSDGLRAQTALGRYGTVEDIGAAVAFLASPAARFITGSVLTVDGGINA